MSETEVKEETVSPIPALLSDEGENDGDTQYKYRDFSHVTKDDDAELAAENPPPAPSSRGNSESSIRVQKFPVKLYVILAQKEFQDIITWMPHGRSWKVLKPSLFESMVMPLFFEYSNYHSFNRLVNAWSFRRTSGGPDRGSYYHELFLRGMPHLHKYMRRLPKTHKKLPMSKKDEPDFYELDKTNPLPSLEDAPIPMVNTNSGGTMGGTVPFQQRESPILQYQTQQPPQQIQHQAMLQQTMRAPAALQMTQVAAPMAPQMVQRFGGEEIYDATQMMPGAMRTGMTQVTTMGAPTATMQPVMMQSPATIATHPSQQGSVVATVQTGAYGGIARQQMLVPFQQTAGQFAMEPAIMQAPQQVGVGMEQIQAGYSTAPFDAAAAVGGGAAAMGGGAIYQYPTTMNVIPAQGYDATLANHGQVMVQQQIQDPMMMRSQIQQRRAFLGVE